MRFLDRRHTPAPACLSRYNHERHEWSALATTRADYEEVVQSLADLQGDRCAYCECDLSSETAAPHVEHFRRRSTARGLTFAWDNLFRSCTHAEHCGKHKDGPGLANAYAPDDLVKPDVEDPRGFLTFTSDGSVAPRAGLPLRQMERADATIRVLALNCPRLRGLRRAFLAAPWARAREALGAGFTDEDLRSLLRDEVEAWAGQPFGSAILDLFGQ